MRDAIAEAVRKPTPEEEENAKAFADGEALMAWYLQQKADERDGHIQDFIDGQAQDKQISVIDNMLDFFGSGKADEDPSSSSSSAVRPKGKAAAPKNTATPEKPFANKVGEVVREKGKPFTVRSKDFDTPHARVYNGDPNKARQREARLIGA